MGHTGVVTAVAILSQVDPVVEKPTPEETALKLLVDRFVSQGPQGHITNPRIRGAMHPDLIKAIEDRLTENALAATRKIVL